jgi:hypothetical protein
MMQNLLKERFDHTPTRLTRNRILRLLARSDFAASLTISGASHQKVPELTDAEASTVLKGDPANPAR